MRWWLAAVAIMMVGGLALPREAAAKGQSEYITFRLSGGDLPHAVTVSLVESTLTQSGLGNWYQGTNLAEPPASETRYHVDEVDARQPNGAALQTWSYVRGTPSVMRALLGGGATAGWAEPVPSIADLLNRYIDLAHQGRLGEDPSFGESLRASASLWPAHVAVAGKDLPSSKGQQFSSLLGQIEPVYFGVQGNLIGQRDLHTVELRISLGSNVLAFAYVPPGPVAPYGLLFGPGSVGNWEALITILNPPGYAQLAYRVPQAFQAMMSDLGYGALSLQDVVAPRTVPLIKAQRAGGLDRIEIWKGSGRHLTLRPPEDGVCGAGAPKQPVAPTSGEAFNVAVWPKGMDPFPEAVQPTSYEYHRPDPSRALPGVLVEVQAGTVYSGVVGALQPPCYAMPEFDFALQAASKAIDRSSAMGNTHSLPGRGKTFALILGGAAAFLTVVAGSELLRRRFGSGSPPGAK